MAQVFQNLLTNAAKYSDLKASIRVQARATAEFVIVEVRDEGIGIAAPLVPRLFDLFVQGERAIDRSEGGLGIGLTIAKSLCEQHGGSIEAFSKGEGTGSTFRVTLPRVLGLAPRVADSASEPRRLADRTRRVLVVDDNADAAEMLQMFLSALGHDVRVAHDGVVALEIARSFEPEVALLDIGLPVMDGYELARRLREQASERPLELIAITGYG